MNMHTELVAKLKMIMENFADACVKEFADFEKELRLMNNEPEPGPLIVKSGDTWVAYWEEVDYLCVEPGRFDSLIFKDREKAIECLKGAGWRSYTGDYPDITRLSPEIAKLWPMVISGKLYDQLVYASNGKILTSIGWNENTYPHFRLATAEELTNAKR